MVTTFLPYRSFAASAACLDKARLGKQRVEVRWILEALNDKSHRLHNHPATRMWRGYRDALVAYGLAVCDEFIARKGDDNQRPLILAHRTTEYVPTEGNVPLPKWLGRDSFHASHRGNLMKKDYQWYSTFGWTDSPLLPYEWPTA
jgi:hypothetical protein